MSTPEAGRHRAPARAKTPLSAISQAVSTNATPAVKASAVLAVSGGLVASLGITQASAGTTHQGTSPTASDYTSSAAPAFGDSSFSATSVAQRAVVRTPGFASLAPAARSTAASRSSDRVALAAHGDVYGPIAPVKAGAPGSAEFGAAVMSIAARYAGIAYVYGGTTPAGFDCSGFVRYVMAQVGISLPRTSSEQRAVTTRIPASAAVPGDLVFFPGHVGIYAGGGMMWDSPHTGSTIGKHPLYSGASFGRV